ncbi:unnamed protein product [Rhizophagus irregularis]|nr:unnamed protein product [Rhizophagus irregularis]
MKKSLKLRELDNHNQLETSYVASFSRQQKGYPKEINILRLALIDVPSFWLVADNLAVDGLARLKVEWNRYLFEEVLPESPIDTQLRLQLIKTLAPVGSFL